MFAFKRQCQLVVGFNFKTFDVADRGRLLVRDNPVETPEQQARNAQMLPRDFDLECPAEDEPICPTLAGTSVSARSYL